MAEVKQNSIPGVPVLSHADMLREVTKRINEVRAYKLSVADYAIAGRDLSVHDRGELRVACQRLASQLREIVLALS